MNEKAVDLENRLIDFAVRVINVVESLPESRAGRHIAGQLVRSGTAPAALYGEAQAAESRQDFIHKMKLCLKELRESLIWLKMIERKPLCPSERMAAITSECNELIAIFVASTKKAATPDKKKDSPSRVPLKIKNQKSKIVNQKSSVDFGSIPGTEGVDAIDD